MKPKTALEKLGQIIIDLEEIEPINYLPHQIEKLKELEKELTEPDVTPAVHGSGTGNQ